MQDPKELLLDRLKQVLKKNQKKFQKAFDKTKKCDIIRRTIIFLIKIFDKKDKHEKIYRKNGTAYTARRGTARNSRIPRGHAQL